MLLVQEILVSESVVEEQFICNLNACKGACCWEGDYGAPLETEELHTLENIYDEVQPFLTKEGRQVLETGGLFNYNEQTKEYETPLINNRACSYMIRDTNGIAKCGIEAAYRAGTIDFIKPISCHLYPIRVKENEKNGFVALNYDQWDICSAACELGKQEKMPVYQFVKPALIRKFGEDFYDELNAMAHYLKEE